MPGLVDPVRKVGTRTREADPFPGGHAAIAAVERIGEVTFAGILQQLREQCCGPRAGKLNLILLKRSEKAILLVGCEVRESFTGGSLTSVVCRRYPRSIQIPRRVA